MYSWVVPIWSSVHPTNARFFLVSGATFFDYTADAADGDIDDVIFGALALDPPSTGDYFAIGWTDPFEATTLTITTAFDGVSGFIWQYWDGATWTALADVVDGTSGFTNLGAGVVSWTVPEDWEPNSVDGVAAYHVRVLWSPWTSTVTPPSGSLISVQGLATDPVYGNNPLDPGQMWDSTFRPILVLDPEWVIWRNVWEKLALEILESQWLTRWRRAITTAKGAQLDERELEIGYLCPDGWIDERCQAVLSAIFAASYVIPTTETVYNLATALLDDGQSFTFEEEFPCSARFTYLNTPEDDAVSYFSALDRARARGCQYFLVAHPGGLGPDPFEIDTSTIDGPDTLADLYA